MNIDSGKMYEYDFSIDQAFDAAQVGSTSNFSAQQSQCFPSRMQPVTRLPVLGV
jgi:hypothetical protein